MYHKKTVMKNDEDSSSMEILKYLKSSNQENLKAFMFTILIATGIIAFVAICVPFFGPLIWAFLIGAIIFPMKRSIATVLNKWFEDLENHNRNIFIALAITPIQVTESYGKVLFDWLQKHWKIIATGVAFAVLLKLITRYAPKGFSSGLLELTMFVHSILETLLFHANIYQLILAVALYLTAVIFYWKNESRPYFIVAGQSLWILIFAYGCSFLGALQVPVLIVVFCSIFIALLYNLRKNGGIEIFSKLLEKNSFVQAVKVVYFEHKDENVSSENKDENISSENKTNANGELEDPPSQLYLKYLFYACIITFLYRNIFMLFIVSIPVTVHVVFIFGNTFGLWNLFFDRTHILFIQAKNWCLDHHSAILPLFLPGLLELNNIIQIYVRRTLKSSVDSVTSILIICLMILFAIFITVFFCANIYSETIEVAYLGKDLINKTITERPELINVLPDNFRDSIDDALDNAHHYGRRKIENYINDMLHDVDSEHGTKLKNQILSIWDRLIQYWIDMNKTDTIGPRVPSEALTTTLEDIVDNPVAKEGIIGWAKRNTNTILEVGESVWRIIHSNISMILGAAGELFSLILSGGQAFVEFFLDMIVFFTTLFYLISNSDTKYAPLQIGSYIGISTSSKVSEALENSIFNVLTAMFKCSIFQGMFVWLTHTILGARIIYLPSLLAVVLSAIPFLGTYWVALPAFLELWLAQDRFYAGILLIVLIFFVPPYFEAEVYAEMKGGGHPYLTGLAIAGGTYWLGWQGSIFGPLLLCIFVGIFNITTSKLRSEKNDNIEIPELEHKTIPE